MTSTGGPWPPSLTLDAARVLDLLTGDRFYSTKDAALREAVLNALDACTRRVASGADVVAAISVAFHEDTLEVVIADNGDGMSRDEVAELFTKIGASMSQLVRDVEAVGEFGIGVISYFLVCDEFDVQTMRSGGSPIGLRFSRAMLDGSTPAGELVATLSEPGTTVTLFLKDRSVFQLLLDRYSHWFRGVEGLTATNLPSGAEVMQGSSLVPSTAVAVALPAWAEQAVIGPPGGYTRWYGLDGRAVVDILYRGVFVESQTVNGLWGLEGTISVHPTHLKPRLNREGFLTEDLQREVVPFLTQVHPAVLEAVLAELADMLDESAGESWSLSRLVALWLAVPRTPPYSEVVTAWDGFFRQRKFFRQLKLDGEADVSLDEITGMNTRLFLAPDHLPQTNDMVRGAVRILRGRGETVVQGVARDTGYLGNAAFLGQSTADLLLNYFAGQLPEIVRVEEVAEQLVAETVGVADLFRSSPKVVLVRLGEEASPVVRAAGELWLNIDTPAGRDIVKDVCEDNQGRRSLLIALHERAEQHAGAMAAFARAQGAGDRLSLIAREYLRMLVS